MQFDAAREYFLVEDRLVHKPLAIYGGLYSRYVVFRSEYSRTINAQHYICCFLAIVSSFG